MIKESVEQVGGFMGMGKKPTSVRITLENQNLLVGESVKMIFDISNVQTNRSLLSIRIRLI